MANASSLSWTLAGWSASVSTRLVMLPGVGHYLPESLYPQIAAEVRALADSRA